MPQGVNCLPALKQQFENTWELAEEKARLLQPVGWVNLSYFAAVKVEMHWFFRPLVYQG